MITIRSALNKLGMVHVTAENLNDVSAIKRDKWIRLRRLTGLLEDHPLVLDHGYPVGHKMLDDLPEDVTPQIGDVLVRQCPQVG